MISKSVKNTQSHIDFICCQKNLFFNNKLVNNNKTSKTLMKPKIQPNIMSKDKKKQKQLDILEIKKMN